MLAPRYLRARSSRWRYLKGRAGSISLSIKNAKGGYAFVAAMIPAGSNL